MIDEDVPPGEILCRDGRPIGDDCPDCNERLRPLREKRERRNAIFAKEDVADWTADDLDFILRERYEPTKVPPCSICGGELSMQSFGGGEPTRWGCSGRGSDGKILPGRVIADDHYSRSIFTDRRQGGDEAVIELLRRAKLLTVTLRAARHRHSVECNVKGILREAGPRQCSCGAEEKNEAIDAALADAERR